MKATVSVICYKHKVLANGESPLMVRIAKDDKHTMAYPSILSVEILQRTNPRGIARTEI